MNKQDYIQHRIHLFLNKKLNDTEVDELWTDILKEPRYLDDIRIGSALYEIYGKRRVQKRAKSSYWPFMAAAAFLGIVLFSLFSNNSSPTVFTISQIELHEMESPEVMRSAYAELSSGDSLLHQAFNATVMGDTDLAISLYNEITQTRMYEPYHGKAYLNKGIIYFNSDNFRQAASAFQAVVARTDEEHEILEKAYWYLGNTYVSLNSLVEARQSILTVYEMNGRYRSEAGSMLISLDSILK